MKKIKLFYNKNQVNYNINDSFSKSPLKPKLLLKSLIKRGFIKNFEIESNFKPLTNEDFKLAHTSKYVESFFKGIEPLASSSDIPWSENHADSVRWTNANLYEAIKNSILNPDQISYSLTSGFHHAMPDCGKGFCTFSGQVIASVKIFKEFKLKGCYIDLDAHFGNSIEDSRDLQFVNEAIPKGFNINIMKYDPLEYIKELKSKLKTLQSALLSGEIDYVVFAHGADSHMDDDLSKPKLDTKTWLLAAELVYDMIQYVNSVKSVPVPFILTLFGGYREDSYQSVLNLHTASVILCLNKLCGTNIKYTPVVKVPIIAYH